MSRAVMSVAPAGPNGTIKRTGRDRIGLRPSEARHGRQRGSARGQMQKICGGEVSLASSSLIVFIARA